MLDFSHIPNKNDIQIFYAQSGSDSWQTWRKPRGAKMVYIMCIGAGGGGGSGRTTSTSLSGGGGGASGGITKFIIHASVIPNILYVQVGIGGAGGIAPTSAGSSIGNAGTNSVVSLYPSNTPSSIICAATGGKPGAGGAADGRNGAQAKGGAATAGFTPTNALFMSLGIYYSEPTVPGAFAATSSVDTAYSQFALNSSVLTGGAGGGSVAAFQGGSVYSSSIFLLSNVTSSKPSTTPKIIENGYGMLSPIFCGTGGAGGYGNLSNVTNPGGKGGDAFYGCGGGGGGPTDSTNPLPPGGTGGKGGDGLVFIITSF